MRREERDGVVLHHFDLAASTPGLVACATGRAGGVSPPPFDGLNLAFHVEDAPEHVRENRRRACAALGYGLDRLTVGEQVHRATVTVVDGTARGRGGTTRDDALPATDALLTDVPGVVLAVLAADCVPIVLHDPGRGVVGVAHAGWRGTVAGVVAATVARMVECFGTDPADVRAGIGPSIGPASYEVGPEVVDAAQAAFPGVQVVGESPAGRPTFDLWAANVAALVGAGVPRAAVEVAGIDTRTSTDEFFSDRAQRPCGRLMALVALPDRGRG